MQRVHPLSLPAEELQKEADRSPLANKWEVLQESGFVNPLQDQCFLVHKATWF